MINLDVELLRTLVAIAKHGTFAQAAEAVCRTQSAITQQMQKLENLTHHPIFIKKGRNKILSPHGEVLLRYAQQILALHDECVRTLHNEHSEGIVRIGAPHDVADSILPTVLAHVVRHLPRIKLEIHVDRSPMLMEAIHRGDVDLTISSRFDPQLEGFVIRRSPAVWLASARYVHDPSKPVPLILADEPSLYRKLALTALENAQIAWQTQYVAPNLSGIKAALHAGLGITARNVELISTDFKVLGASEHLPVLPDVPYYLWMRRSAPQSHTHRVYELLDQHMALNSPLNPTV